MLIAFFLNSNHFSSGIHQTVVVVDFLRIVFWGLGAVGGGTGGKL